MNILKGKTRLAAGVLLFALTANPLCVSAAEQAQAAESTVETVEKAADQKADIQSLTKKKAKGKKVVKYAKKFLGNPYVYGGNSLTHGCDCSGFVVQIYKHFDVDLSAYRNSRALRTVGKQVSLKNIKEGDIVCYNGHVAIYSGDGKIVEALNSRVGIVNTRSVSEDPIITIRRVVK